MILKTEDTDLIFHTLNDATYALIPSFYQTLNNYGFLCILIGGNWSDVPKLILSCENLAVSYCQETKYTHYDGFKFYELYIRANVSLLVLRKIVLNREKIPCPKCSSDDYLCVNGYSNNRVISWECKNPNCEKSEGGRGHRFSEITEIPRVASLMEEAIIPDDVIRLWRRDIEQEDVSLDQVVEIARRRYSYPWSKVSINQDFQPQEFQPHIEDCTTNLEAKESANDVYESSSITILHGNSQTIDYGNTLQGVNVVYTSPPYYNAREYSQYTDVFDYIKQMKKVFLNIIRQSKQVEHFYINLSDIVCKDCTYTVRGVRRKFPISLMLSYHLEEIGLYLNKIYFWDKGEPQSKRHLNPNKTPVYNKPLNAFEYVLFFTKQKTDEVPYDFVKVNPVIKVNSKGENKSKHTAPYPLALIEKTMERGHVRGVLDPFLGSGTTAIWCKEWGVYCVGVEIDQEYYNLSCLNLDKTQPYFF